MQLQFSRQYDHDLDRLYAFLIDNKATLKTADRALLTIKDAAKSLLTSPEIGTSLGDAFDRRELYIRFGKNGYTLRYVPDYDANVIRVLRVWHSREDRE